MSAKSRKVKLAQIGIHLNKEVYRDMQGLTPLIKDLAIMLGFGSIAIIICQRLRQPTVLGYLLAGIAMGPYILPAGIIKDISNIETLSELGVIFLIFSLGLEFSFQKLSRVGFSAGLTGVFEVILMMGLGFLTGHLLGWNFFESLFLGAALSISSTMIIIKAIDELGLKRKRFAEIISGILVVEDLIAILLLVILSSFLTTHNFFSLEVLKSAGKLALVVCGWFLTGYFLIPTVVRRIIHYANDEAITIISVGLCLSLVCVAVYFNYSVALGAFIMGSILAETPAIHRIEHLIKPIRDIFAAIFFISVGMLINPWVIIQQWPIVLVVTLVTIVGKLMTTTLGALLTGQSLSNSLRIGLGMSQVGEFSFIIISLGLSFKVVSEDIYSIIVAVSGITTFTTPYFIRFSSHASRSITQHFSARIKYLLDSYAEHVHHWLHSKPSSLLKRTRIRLVVNGIVVAIIFTLIHQFVLPNTLETTHSAWFAKTICWLLALLLSSPFIWGMLFSARLAQLAKDAPSYLNITKFLAWTITILVVSILSITYFHTWLIMSFLITLFTLFFSFSYRHLEKAYQWFEAQLVENIKSKEDSSKYKELIAWDSYIVEITVNEQAAFSGKRLNELHPLQEYGINIIAIYRNHHMIKAPGGEEKILPGDKLIILGSEEKIDLFRKNTEFTLKKEKKPILEDDLLSSFGLKNVALTPGHPLIGKKISESKIREKEEGLIVGIERNGTRILNPTPDTLLEMGDILMIAGETDSLEHFDHQ